MTTTRHQGFGLSAVTLLSTLWEGRSSTSSQTSSEACFIPLHHHNQLPSAGTLWASTISGTNANRCIRSTGPWILKLPWTHPLSPAPGGPRFASSLCGATVGTTDSTPTWHKNDRVRIAIVGGGIAGVTAASAIASRLSNADLDVADIVVFEGDAHADAPYQSESPPPWRAATARNANSIVPGATMHILCQRSTLYDIARDTFREWSGTQYERLHAAWAKVGGGSKRVLPNIDNFEMAPPYFALHLFQCLGPQAAWDERRSFVTFLWHFLTTSLLTGPTQADERAKYLVQLAKANREVLERDMMGKPQFGLTKGFLSLQRSDTKAQHTVQEARQFGEEADLVSWQRAVELEPHLKNLPFSPIYAALRHKDITANCLLYVQYLKDKCHPYVQFREKDAGAVVSIERIQNKPEKLKTKSILPGRITASEEMPTEERPMARFRITTADGLHYETDYIVLAAGINTPLLAQQVDAAHCCPTYPLRGYSLTLYSNKEGNKDGMLLLSHPFSIDSLYVTSVGTDMARLAGFGELVGYREAAIDVPSVGPQVLARYGRSIFPEADNVSPDDALQCFRPLSPDDLPLAGKVSSVPGLFLHSGHGTLGWTLSLATAECVAQALAEDVQGLASQDCFELPDNTTIDRRVVSPDRFA